MEAKAGQKVYVWEPSNPDGITHCYNPIDWVSSKPGQMVDDVQKISNLIMPEKDFGITKQGVYFRSSFYTCLQIKTKSFWPSC